MTTLYYYRARYYDATLERFINRDPAGYIGSPGNLYAYAAGNPLRFIDPSGLSAITIDVFIIDDSEFYDMEFECATASEKGWWGTYWQELKRAYGAQADIVQGGLDVAGTFEPTPFCDLANACISGCRGDKTGVATSLMGVVPYVGDAGKIYKYGNKVSKGGGKVYRYANKTRRVIAKKSTKVVSKALDMTAIKKILHALPRGRQGHVRTVANELQINNLFLSIKKGGKQIQAPNYNGVMYKLPDGTLVGRRVTSGTGGATLDIRFIDGSKAKVHIK